jgi:polyisoprenoid-binding protein YceI
MCLLLSSLAFAAPFRFAPEDGTLGFHAVASLHEFDGKAGDFSAEFDPTTGKGLLTVGVKSLSTGIGARDSRMVYTSLDAVTWPQLSFRIDGVDDEGGVLTRGQGQAGVSVRGHLKIRDVEQEVVVPAEARWEGGNLRIRGDFPLYWADYGVPDPSILISTLRPDVTVRFDLLGKPQ